MLGLMALSGVSAERIVSELKHVTFLVLLGNPRRFDHDEHTHGGSTPFIIFKVTLALLVPVFLLLVGAFLWRLHKLKAQVGEWRSNEDSKSIGLTGNHKGPRKGALEVGCTDYNLKHIVSALNLACSDRKFGYLPGRGAISVF